ncbi:CpsD/CapB family tyrosine-protein kinase [Tropicibacter sp. S64]|uniref:CpsD/CapB family tyrosine-protein kinase n=1 Tax=Tropicibacter sp. S64 TaxID=3415122 RepID=UPI003C7A2037
MMDRPKFRRKFRRSAGQDESAAYDEGVTPIEPLESREDRLARRQAEEQSAAEVREKARKAREEAERLEAEALAAAEREAREAEAEARREAELERQRKAYEERQAAEAREREKRRKEEELAARRAKAEAEARRKAEEQERLQAQRRARLDAIRKAKADAIRKAAEEEAAREAEEAARREAEERARQEAEEAARREAEARARKETEEAARREAEDRARKDAEEATRREAEERARKEAEEAARREAENRARKEAEEAARREAEDRARRDAEETARREAAESERKARYAARRREASRREEAEREAEAQAARRTASPAPLELTDPVAPVHSTQGIHPWEQVATFDVNENHLAANRIITATREDPAYTAFDVLRTRLLQALSENGWKRVAITSPTKDCGKTFTAANLAISLSRQENCRTLLLDCDMRRPTLQKVMGRTHPGSMGDMLRGKIDPQDHLLRLGKNSINAGRNIAFGFNEVIEPYASELLQDPRTAATLTRIETEMKPDVMLFDLPPALYYDDVIAFRPLFDGVLLVVGGGITTEKEIKEVERRLGEETPLLGMVLNKAENTEISKYQY